MLRLLQHAWCALAQQLPWGLLGVCGAHCVRSPRYAASLVQRAVHNLACVFTCTLLYRVYTH